MTKNFDDVKKLGFGLMRLPQKEGVIDVERVKTMVDMFLDAGFNYFDTAFAYAGSEDAIRQALVNRVPRENFFLPPKMPHGSTARPKTTRWLSLKPL